MPDLRSLLSVFTSKKIIVFLWERIALILSVPAILEQTDFSCLSNYLIPVSITSVEKELFGTVKKTQYARNPSSEDVCKSNSVRIVYIILNLDNRELW